MRKIKTILIIFAFLGVSFFAYKFGVFVGEENILKTPPPQIINQDLGQPEKVNFSIFWEAWRKLERDFLDKEKIDYQKMVYGAIKGMVESLEDPYTTFFTPKETEEFELELSGKYEGVGMEIAIKEGQLQVVTPFEGTPADIAGLRPGDKILKIDDTLTQDLPIEEAVNLIRGPRGTEVRLLIQRDSWLEPREIKLKREVIKIPTLKWELKEEDIALIKIYQFNQILSSEFKKVALEVLNSKAKKIILDLRNNPGGYLDKAVEIAGWFLPKGEVIVWQDMGEEKERKAYKSKGPGTFSDYPLVVLINEGSASGAEILAGALRDQKGVKLIGETSFGKGSVQEQLDLSDGSSLKVTIAKWLTPKGESIDKKGLTPDIKVEISEEDWEENRDPQLEKAIEILKSQ
jgi:carboxyl-terminal processing protease